MTARPSRRLSRVLLVAVTYGLIATPVLAKPTIECEGEQGACTWEVSWDEEQFQHWFEIECPSGGSYSPIDPATACDLCCVM